MTVRSRLILTMAGITLLIAVPAIYAVTRLAQVRDIALGQRGQHGAAFSSLGRLQASMAELDRFQRSYVAAPSEELRRGVREALTRARYQLARLGQVGYGEHARDAAARLDALDRATAELEQLVQAGQVTEATALFERVKPALASMQEALDELGREIDRRSRGDATEAKLIAAAAATTTLLALLVSLTLAVALGLWATRAITRPISRLRSGMAGVGDDGFESPRDLPYDRSDEIGDLARSFRAMADRLAELDKLRAEFTSMATHELKTPLNVIGGYAELLGEGLYGPVDEQQREALESIMEQTRSLTELVNQLASISRLEAGGFPVHVQEVATEDVLNSVRRSFNALAKQKRIRFDVEADEAVPATIRADPDRLRNEVLGNLLSNAFKFTPAGGRIALKASGADGVVRMQVSDTGPGIPPEDLPHVFEKFYQAGGEGRAAGSGLGLAIARQIALEHGGDLSVSSEPGQGTTFSLELPQNGRGHAIGEPREWSGTTSS